MFSCFKKSLNDLDQAAHTSLGNTILGSHCAVPTFSFSLASLKVVPPAVKFFLPLPFSLTPELSSVSPPILWTNSCSQFQSLSLTLSPWVSEPLEEAKDLMSFNRQRMEVHTLQVFKHFQQTFQ